MFDLWSSCVCSGFSSGLWEGKGRTKLPALLCRDQVPRQRHSSLASSLTRTQTHSLPYTHTHAHTHAHTRTHTHTHMYTHTHTHVHTHTRMCSWEQPPSRHQLGPQRAPQKQTMGTSAWSGRSATMFLRVLSSSKSGGRLMSSRQVGWAAAWLVALSAARACPPACTWPIPWWQVCVALVQAGWPVGRPP